MKPSIYLLININVIKILKSPQLKIFNSFGRLVPMNFTKKLMPQMSELQYKNLGLKVFGLN